MLLFCFLHICWIAISSNTVMPYLRFSPIEKLFIQPSLIIIKALCFPLTFTIIKLCSLPLLNVGISQMLSSSEHSLNFHPSLLPDCCHTHSPPSFHFHSLWPVWDLDFAHSSVICCHFFVSITLSSPCSLEKLKLLLQLKRLLDPFLLFLGVTFLRILLFISFFLYNIFWGDSICRCIFNLTIGLFLYYILAFSIHTEFFMYPQSYRFLAMP